MDKENIFFDIKKLKHCGKNVIIGKTVRIRHPEKVSIGDNVIIDDFCYISGEVDIGDYVHVGNGCTLSASQDKIVLGSFSTTAPGVKIFCGSSNYLKCGLDIPTLPQEYQYNVIRGNVILDRFVLLGANCVVSPGVHIPEGCAFGANTIVKKSLNLKAWHLVFDNKGVMRKREGVEELLKRVEKFLSLQLLKGV